MNIRLLLTSLILFLLHSLPAEAQWRSNGTIISSAASAQASPSVVSDGAGGAIIAWADNRNAATTVSDIYVQRIDGRGVVQWTADGVALCTATGNQYNVSIVSDGAGGAIVVWDDFRSGTNWDVYARRVNASGVPQWTNNGVVVCAASNGQFIACIASDGAGGAIIAWEDYRSGTNYDIYAQRINVSGAAQWAANGIGICTATGNQSTGTIISDGVGGAIVAWHDYRSGTNYDIYAQRVNASGAVQWTANGVVLSNAANAQAYPKAVADGAGGAIVAWEDYRSGANNDIYAQRVNASGAVQWTANGVAVCTAADVQDSPRLVSDGAGGAVIAWNDNRSGNVDIYAQRVSASGVPQWTYQGAALCTATGTQYRPTLVSDGNMGAIVTWYDLRSGAADIYAQRIDAWEATLWTANGVALCTAPSFQWDPMIASDGAGGAIVAWYDQRSGDYDVYAQRVEGRYGYWGRPEPTLVSVGDIRNDQGGKVKVNWTASGRDVPNQQTIAYYSVWRATDVAAAASAAASDGVVEAPSDIGRDFEGPAVWVQRLPTTDYYWEWVGNQGILYQPAYTFSAPTRSDSTSLGNAMHRFMVVAHTWDTFIFWTSNVVSGYSVDNLAPAAPLYLTANRVGSDVQLKWNRVRVPDLRDYSVYRATAMGVTPVPLNFLSSASDTVLVDASAPTSALYYIVTAYDVHENQSPASNEASVSATTNVGATPSITQLTVLQNRPNPFTSVTELQIGLPADGDVSVEIYDVAGRRVNTLEVKGARAGWRNVAFSGRDQAGTPLPSGVYFYKVRANGTTVTHKMVIAR